MLRFIFRLQPVIALAVGVLFVIFLRRGFEYIPVAVAFTAAALFFILYRLYRFSENTSPLIRGTSFAAEQFLTNNVLMFILPFYLESMTVPSLNMLFVVFIVLLTAASNWINFYRKWIVNRPGTGAAFYAVTIFSVLNFIFPVIIGLRNSLSIILSGAVAAVITLALIYPHMPGLKNIRSAAVSLLAVVMALAGLWLLKPLIPPAPLRLLRAAACTGVENHNPVDSFSSIAAEPGQNIYFFTSIFAPRGLKDRIEHVWYHNKRKLISIDIKEIQGSGRGGFATWSTKRLMEGPGEYTVEVRTSAGQMIGRGGFIVTAQ
jgi:hypothetical protein